MILGRLPLPWLESPPPLGPFLPSPEAVPQEPKSPLGWAGLGCQRLLSLALILESVTERGRG